MKLTGHNCHQRRGTLIFAVLVCILVATTIVLGTVHMSSRFRRQLRDDLRVEQARWLLDGGVRMAITKLRHQPDYQGETIVLDANRSLLDAGTVNIRFAPSVDDDIQVRLHVTAELQRESGGRPDATQSASPESRLLRARTIRRSADILVSVPNETKSRN